MRVQVHPADKGGCGYYRLRWPAQSLIEQGHDVVVVDDALEGVTFGIQDGYRRVVKVPDINADAIVFQRPLNWEITAAIPLIQQQGVAVIVEVDDDFAALHPNNPAFRNCHPRRNPQRNWLHLAEACKVADLVTVTTPALATRYGSHGRVAILPNCVPDIYLKIDPVAVGCEWEEGMPPVLGWTGTPSTHPGDLDVVGAAVSLALKATDAEFWAIGSEATLQKLGVEGRVSPWLDLRTQYAQAVAQLQVGMVPLAITPFNEAKSYLKGLEFAALGVPFVASPTSEYVKLAARGAGTIAHKRRDWTRELRALLSDTELRQERAAQGRAAVQGFTYDQQAWRWMEQWDMAIAERKVKKWTGQ